MVGAAAVFEVVCSDLMSATPSQLGFSSLRRLLHAASSFHSHRVLSGESTTPAPCFSAASSPLCKIRVYLRANGAGVRQFRLCSHSVLLRPQTSLSVGRHLLGLSSPC